MKFFFSHSYLEMSEKRKRNSTVLFYVCLCVWLDIDTNYNARREGRRKIVLVLKYFKLKKINNCLDFRLDAFSLSTLSVHSVQNVIPIQKCISVGHDKWNNRAGSGERALWADSPIDPTVTHVADHVMESPPKWTTCFQN